MPENAQFNLSFDWKPGMGWDEDDVIEYYLYTAKNMSQPIASGSIKGFPSKDRFLPTTLKAIGQVSPADIGEALIIEFNFNAQPGEFARIDNVRLSVVNAKDSGYARIPEPQSYSLLLSLVALSAALIRRR